MSSLYLKPTTGRLRVKDPASRFQLQGSTALVPPGTPWAWYKNGTGIFSDAAGTTPATNGGIVRYWADSSGNARHAIIGVPGQDPLYGTTIGPSNLPCVYTTTSTGIWLKSAGESISMTRITMAIVWKQHNDGGSSYSMPLALGNPAVPGNGAGYNIRTEDPSATTRAFEKGVEAAYSGTPDYTNWYSLVGVHDASVLKFYSNGTLKVTSAANTQSLIATTAVGLFRPEAANYQAHGYMAEAIIWNSDLSAANLTALQAYFVAKFGNVFVGTF